MIAVTMRAAAVIATSLGVLASTAVPGSAAGEPVPAAAAPCTPTDLVLRQVNAPAAPAPDAEAVYALRNLGSTSCSISGAVSIRLFDAQGKPIDVRFAVRNTMATLVTLAPGDEASFSISFGSHPPMDSETTARIDVYVAAQLVPVSAPTTIAAYSGPLVRISNLRRMLPVPARLISP